MYVAASLLGNPIMQFEIWDLVAYKILFNFTCVKNNRLPIMTS